MAPGWWNKLKKGIKKAVGWVKDKVVKPVVRAVAPVLKPLAKTGVKTLANTFVPGSGNYLDGVIDKGMGAVERWANG